MSVKTYTTCPSATEILAHLRGGGTVECFSPWCADWEPTAWSIRDWDEIPNPDVPRIDHRLVHTHDFKVGEQVHFQGARNRVGVVRWVGERLDPPANLVLVALSREVSNDGRGELVLFDAEQLVSDGAMEGDK
mgnify:CR=1 FL=1